MNWFSKHLSWTILISVVAFMSIALSISIWVGEEEGWMFFGVVPVAIVGYLFGEDRGKNKVGEKLRKAKEDAHRMIESKSSLFPVKGKSSYGSYRDVTINGSTYNDERFLDVSYILEQEAKRHRHEAEEEERLLEELNNLLPHA